VIPLRRPALQRPSSPPYGFEQLILTDGIPPAAHRRQIMADTNRPTHSLFIVTQDETGDSQWTEVGAAWENKDGKGYNVKFKLYPRPGDQVVMRIREERNSRD
jgi:hypothetical protein